MERCDIKAEDVCFFTELDKTFKFKKTTTKIFLSNNDACGLTLSQAVPLKFRGPTYPTRQQFPRPDFAQDR